MDMIKVTINGVEYSVAAGSTVLEAAKAAHIDIPTLCYLKDINEIGACRLCLVEVSEKRGPAMGPFRMVTACVYPCTDGMVIKTNTPKITASRKMNLELAQPNDAHIVLAEMEKDGKLSAVITQNIDGLHQKAGSKNVIELHGTSLKNYCVKCGKNYDLNYVLEKEGVPYCEDCHGFVRPDVVMYREGLNTRKFYDAEEAIYYADVLIVGGTSLTVQPAASLIDSYQGEHLIIINKTPTPYDGLAEFVIRDSIAEVLPKIYG